MPPVRAVRTVWIVAGLLLGFAVVLGAPMFLLWDVLVGSPLSDTTLKAEFQSMRYESGGMIFRYTIHNFTRHTAQFLPTLTEIRTLQPDGRPAVGFANLLLPFEVPPHGSHVVDVRLELAIPRDAGSSLLDEQTRRVLQNQPPDGPLPPDSPVSPLPMQGPIAAPAAPLSPEFSLQQALTDLNGFIVEDSANGIRLVLPRGW